MMSLPLLSIVVPTKDRYFYLKKLIELLDGFCFDNVEMVIQDNTENNSDIRQYLESNEYGFIVYDHHSEPMPITKNSDLAVQHSSGEYVCFIGDDDGVTRYIIDCVQWMKKNGIDVVLPSTVSYSWPDAKGNHKAGLDLSSKISFDRFTGKLEEKDSMSTLKELMQRGCVDRGDIPLLYHGIVKRTVLDKIYAKCQTYFPGPSPDIANGVALCLVSPHFYTVDLPITIAGASKHHGGGIKKMKNRAADIDSVPFLPPHAKENWDKRIPLIWTGETVWCESAVKAMINMGRKDLADNVNYEALYSRFSTFHYPLRELAYNLTANKYLLFTKSNWGVVVRYWNALLRMIRLHFNFNGNKVIKTGLDNIVSAVTYLHSLPIKISFLNEI